ncbi:MAG: dihydropteroate synthase [Promethearchaeota archaeon]
MKEINTKFFGFLEIGDNHPTILMGVLNLSPESFYKGSIYESPEEIKHGINQMVTNGAKMLDLGARSTAPWSKKITIEEEIRRIIPAMEIACKTVPEKVVITVDTQYEVVARKAHDIAMKYGKPMMINDVSCLKTDPSLSDLLIEREIPVVLMASKKLPGDVLTVDEMIDVFSESISNLKKRGYDDKNIILDPGIGKWIEEKVPKFDLSIINNLEKLRTLQKPILIAISRKSFIGAALNLPEPEDRLNGTLSATSIAVYKGAHIVRTHNINDQLRDIVKIAEQIRMNK